MRIGNHVSHSLFVGQMPKLVISLPLEVISIIISLTVDSAKDIAKAELGLNIDTTRGSLAIPDKALESIARQSW